MVCNLASAGRVVEEVEAVIDSTPILTSDVSLAELVGLLPRDPGEDESDYRSRLLGARIRLELQYRDLEESGTLYRLVVDTESVRTRWVTAGGGEDAVLARISPHGLTLADLDQLALRVAAAAAYTDQRLRPRISIGLDEIEAAYQELVVHPLEADHEPVPPLAQVRDQVHRLLVERKLNAEIAAWLAEAADRHEVTRFAP
jgi:hypothetical protein